MKIKGIICGLGNPGRKYASTRHNAGFMVIDRLIESSGKIPREQVRLKTEAPNYILWEWTLDYGPHVWLLLKPMTFMNRSGAALSKVFSRAAIEPDRLLIIHDEVDLPLGKLKIKSGGGLAGHNGLRSIANDLGTRDFVRLRFGVGRPDAGFDLSQYVLDNFLPAERDVRDQVTDRAVEVIRTFCDNGLDKAGEKIAMFSSRTCTIHDQ